jgi:flagellar hook assembly protein FlgD
VDAAAIGGRPYRYRLVALDPDELIVGEIMITPTIPLALDQNTPNPFRTETTIRISTPGPARATLSIYGVDGSLIRTLLDGPVDGDVRVLTWNGRDARGRSVPSGVYFCRLTVGKESLTRKIVLAR